MFLFERECLKRFELIQNTRAATKRHSRKRTSRTAVECGNKDGLSGFEVRESILRG